MEEEERSNLLVQCANVYWNLELQGAVDFKVFSF